MRKLFIILLCMLGIMASAEDVKIALLQPLTVSGSTACNPMEISMVRGELRKAFGWQSDFQILTRMDVDAMLKEQGFQRSGMVEDNQRKQIGIMTSAQYICVSSITKYGTQIYIEAYLVDVETGQMTNPATQYANVKNDDYSTLSTACSELAKEMLGEITDKRKPTSGSVKSIVDYVNLGLPSGTLWKTENEDCGLITYDQAHKFYGINLPTKEQWEELKDNCLWTWIGNGYKVKGKNGKSIFIPAAGIRFCDGSETAPDSYGVYWSSTPFNTENACMLLFDSEGPGVYNSNRCCSEAVRLVR